MSTVSFSPIEAVIPSESAINIAKEKRNRLRAVGTDNDFISLSVERREDVPNGPHPESRLMREDDEIGEGEEGHSCNLIYIAYLINDLLLYRTGRVYRSAGAYCIGDEES